MTALPPERVLDGLGDPVEEFALPPHRFLVNLLVAVPVFLFGLFLVAVWTLVEFGLPGRAPWLMRLLTHLLVLLPGVWFVVAAVRVPLRTRPRFHIVIRADQPAVRSEQAILANLNAIDGLDIAPRHIARVATPPQPHTLRRYHPRCPMHRPPSRS